MALAPTNIQEVEVLVFTDICEHINDACAKALAHYLAGHSARHLVFIGSIFQLSPALIQRYPDNPLIAQLRATLHQGGRIYFLHSDYRQVAKLPKSTLQNVHYRHDLLLSIGRNSCLILPKPPNVSLTKLTRVIDRLRYWLMLNSAKANRLRQLTEESLALANLHRASTIIYGELSSEQLCIASKSKREIRTLAPGSWRQTRSHLEHRFGGWSLVSTDKTDREPAIQLAPGSRPPSWEIGVVSPLAR